MGMMRNIILIGILLLFVSLGFATDVPNWLYIFPGNEGYILVSALVGVMLLASTVLIALVWAVGTILSNDGIKAWCKTELFEVIYSAVLFIFIFSFFPVFDALIAEVVEPMYTTETVAVVTKLAQVGDGYKWIPKHFRYPKYFLASLSNEGIDFNKEIIEWYSITGLLGDIYMSLDLFWEQRSFINYNPLKGFVHIGNVIKQQVFDFVAKVIIISKFQEIFLHFIVTGFFPIFLAAGTILRSFQLTRKLGGLLMAIALGLYFIFPMAYILAGSIYDNIGGVGQFNIEVGDDAQHLLNPIGAAYLDDSTPIAEMREMFGHQTDFGDTDVDNRAEALSNSLGFDVNSLEVQLFANTQGETTVEGATQQISTVDLCRIINAEDQKCDEDTPCPAGQVCSADEGHCIDEGAQSMNENLQGWVSEFQRSDISFWEVDTSYFDYTARLIFFSMFFSFFGLMATVAGIRSISQTFGGDLEIAGLTHLI